MKFFRNRTIIQQLYILFPIALVLSLVAVLAFYSSTFRSLQDEKKIIYENAVTNAAHNVEDITTSVMLMAETVSNTSFTQSYLTVSYMPHKVVQQQQLQRLASRLSKSIPAIKHILIMDNTGVLHNLSSFDYLLVHKLDSEYGLFSPDTCPEGFTGALTLPDTDEIYFAYCQPILNEHNSEQIGTCIIICSSDPIREVCSRSAIAPNTLFSVLDSSGEIIASNQDTISSQEALSREDSGTSLVLHSDSSLSSNWTIFCSVPYAEIYQDLTFFRTMAILLVLALLFSFILLAVTINRSIAVPIVRIVEFLKKKPDYILHHQLNVYGSREISTLSTNINEMLVQINQLTDTVIEKQKRMYAIELSENKAKLMALQTQINPHFLYNALNSIQGLVYQEKGAEINTIVAALSFLLRYSLHDDNTATVKDEFLCIERYLKIMEIRFPNRFRFSLSMDESLANCRMPRFLLQPLVENAISHGLLPSTKGNMLSLCAFMKDKSTLHIECSDNGIGIAPDILFKLNQELNEAKTLRGTKSDQQSKIGLLNIHMRLRFLYGESYGLSISSNEEGTTISLDIPTSDIGNTSHDEMQA